jgi:hypothetical protein
MDTFSTIRLLVTAGQSSINLANGYKGILTATLPWKRLETFEDAIASNFSILTEIRMNIGEISGLTCPEFGKQLVSQNFKIGTSFQSESEIFRALELSLNSFKGNRTSQFSKRNEMIGKIERHEDSGPRDKLHIGGLYGFCREKSSSSQ